MSTKRPSTLTDRDRRRTPSSGIPVAVTREDPTPPPQQMPALPRTVTGDNKLDVRLDTIEQQTRELTDAMADVWGARDVDKRLDRMRDDLAQNTRSTVRMEAVLGELVVPTIKETMAKLDTCMHHLAASSHLAATVATIVEKLDGHGGRFGSIEQAQATAAVRFDEHDKRDQEMAAAVNLIRADVDELKQARAVDDNTNKVTKMVAKQRSWWFSAKGVSTVIAAVVAGVVAIIAATQGGCS